MISTAADSRQCLNMDIAWNPTVEKELAALLPPALKLGHPPQEPVPQVTHHAQANLFERGF